MASRLRWFGYGAALAGLLFILSGMQTPVATQEAPPVAKAHEQPGLLPEPRFLTTAFDFGAKYTGTSADKRDGLYPVFGGLYTGAGWISLGGGYRQHVLGDNVFYDAFHRLSRATSAVPFVP